MPTEEDSEKEEFEVINLIEGESQEKIEMKKLFRLQKDGIVSVKDLVLRPHERRN